MAEDPSPKNKPKRKWRRRMLWFVVITLSLLWSVNGPIARWGAHYGIDTALAGLGMQGDCKVKGTLTHGFTVSDFSYQGDAGIQDITFTEVSADYRLLKELIHGKVRSITLKDAFVMIDIDKFIPSESSEEDSTTKLKETIAVIRQWVSQPEITLSKIDVSLLKSGEKLAHFQLEELHHSPNSADYTISNFQAQDGDGNTTPLQHVKLVWNEQSIDLNRFEVLPDIAIEKAHANWSNKLTANAEVQLLSATLEIELNDNIAAHLTSGSLDAETLSKRFDLQLPLDFSLHSVDAKVENWLDPMPEWIIDLEMDLPSVSYDEYKLSDTKLKISQHQSKFSVLLTSQLNTAPVELKVTGDWLNPKAEKWWNNAVIDYELHTENLSKISSLFIELPAELDVNKCVIQSSGKVRVINQKLQTLDANFSIKGISVQETTLPNITVQGSFQTGTKGTIKLVAENNGKQSITLDATYHFEKDTYDAQLTILEDQPKWINSLLQVFKMDVQLEAPIDIKWQGSGSSDFNRDQLGSLKINNLTAKVGEENQACASLSASYHWPESITVDSIKVEDGDFSVTTAVVWDSEKIFISDGLLNEKENQVAHFSANIPYSLDIGSLQEFFEQEAEWNFSVESEAIKILQIRHWLRLQETRQLTDLEGSAALGINLTGSPQSPNLNGFVNLENLRGLANKNLAALHMKGEFATSKQRLNFSGQLLEATAERASVVLDIPFTPLKWIREKEDIDKILAEAELDGSLEIKTLPLNRVARLVPQLKEITGHLTGQAEISGTLLDPKINLDTQIKIPKLVIAGDEIDDIRDLEINCTANTDRQIKADLKASINGGTFKANATADLTDISKPVFDVTMKTNHAMVFRNDAISMRANADIQLKGDLEDATLSGEIGFVESLFYKDIDILPIGVPSSAVADVELPAISTKLLPEIPEPFDKWKLDLKIKMSDPLLIRGNLAGGQIEGGVKATGTFAEPALDGSIIAKDVVARLPFSQLKIHKGHINFDSKNGLIPSLDIQGKSTVSGYDTTIFIYGPATAPKTTFTSYPPLSKTDIMTLLATGVTASGLNDNKQVATLRALQLLLVKLRQESGESRSTKALETVLSSIEDFEFNINETDGFTGRKFSSAKIKINDKFYFSAQVDENKQTRGLIVYILRFR